MHAVHTQCFAHKCCVCCKHLVGLLIPRSQYYSYVTTSTDTYMREESFLRGFSEVILSFSFFWPLVICGR